MPPSAARRAEPAKRIRVAHVITDLGLGGAEMALARLLEQLDPARFESLVVSLVPGGTIAERIAAAGFPVASAGMSLRAAPLAALGAAPRLVRALRAWRPDVIQGWMYHGNLAASVAAAWLRPRPAVAWNVRQSLATLNNEKRQTRVVIRLCARLSRRVTRIVNNSEASVRQHEAIGFAAGRSVVIPNGFDTAHFAPSEGARAALRSELGLGADALLVGTVARWHPVKRYDILVAAAGEVVGRGVDAHFALVGPGVTMNNPEIRAAVEQSGASARLHLLGERSDIPRIMAGLDVLVSASGWAEGFPNVVGEAMSSGVPCVVSDTGDSAAIVGEHGIVVPAADSAALASGIERLLRLPEAERRALGFAARQRIAERYGIEAIAGRYATLYDELAAGRTD